VRAPGDLLGLVTTVGLHQRFRERVAAAIDLSEIPRALTNG
jgi:hypothetical protein